MEHASSRTLVELISIAAAVVGDGALIQGELRPDRYGKTVTGELSS